MALLATASAGLLRAGAGVPSDNDMAAYLLVYFKDEDHSLHFALSLFENPQGLAKRANMR